MEEVWGGARQAEALLQANVPTFSVGSYTRTSAQLLI